MFYKNRYSIVLFLVSGVNLKLLHLWSDLWRKISFGPGINYNAGAMNSTGAEIRFPFRLVS